MVRVAGLALIAATGLTLTAPASACTIAVSYTPLMSRPAGTTAVLLVDVVALRFPIGGPVADVRVVRVFRGKGNAGDRLAMPYLRSPCGERREPGKAERLVAYVTKDRVLGWATLAEARRFDRAVR